MPEFSWPKFLEIAAPVVLGAVAASLATRVGWKNYNNSRKAPFTPPRFVFPLVWTTIYILIIAAGYLTLAEIKDENTQRLFLAIFYIQVLLNFMWCLVFFGFGDARLGLITIVFLIFSVIYLIYESFNYSTLAAWFFVVYLGWLLFATFLNVGFIAVNQM